MITFTVVKEQYGWAIRTGASMTTPFWSREVAIQEANCLADSIRSHGVSAEVVVEDAAPGEAPTRGGGVATARLQALLNARRGGPVAT